MANDNQNQNAGAQPGAQKGEGEALPVLVINRTKAAHSLAYTANPKEASASTTITVLHPGVNLLTGKDALAWAKLRKSEDVERMLDARDLVVPVDSKGKALKEHPVTLGELDSPVAVELVESTVRAEICHAWLQSEKRREVVKALNDQLQIIKDFERRAGSVLAGV